jgi:hypothetical protein
VSIRDDNRELDLDGVAIAGHEHVAYGISADRDACVVRERVHAR